MNAWGSERSYTQIVADPGSQDPKLNPNFYTWKRSITQASVALAFALPDVVSVEVLSKNESGTVAMIQATSSTGVQKSLRGETFRSRTRIPSAYFDLVGVQIVFASVHILLLEQLLCMKDLLTSMPELLELQWSKEESLQV